MTTQSIICTECKSREWLVYGCINNDHKGAEICLYCCKCPEHEEYWGDLCCEHGYESACD